MDLFFAFINLESGKNHGDVSTRVTTAYQPSKVWLTTLKSGENTVVGLMESVGVKLRQHDGTTGECDFRLLTMEGGRISDVLAALKISRDNRRGNKPENR